MQRKNIQSIVKEMIRKFNDGFSDAEPERCIILVLTGRNWKYKSGGDIITGTGFLHIHFKILGYLVIYGFIMDNQITK